ncbi:MAG TPA: Sir2 family NAD-dependent protein deacetylase [Burkholderiaceae bacterium]|nr:Sir2 family NAD-dependent protein deacetylase [Burkholderiaceae bacterium]
MATEYEFIKAAQLLSHADGLIIAAGAGMGVDSGLPDFRGNTGFWQHYPALRKSGIDFQNMASPSHFWSSPRLAWGFYGHRLTMYRQTQPHGGFQILKDIASRLPHNAFVYTSNVDGQFQKAGFAEDRIHECHGSLHHLQCIDACRRQIWSSQVFAPVVDNDSCWLMNDLPVCPVCGLIARPNVLMFSDVGWVSRRTDEQRDKLHTWLRKVSTPVVIELGAGTAIDTVRRFSERQRGPLIRINVHEAQMQPSSQHVSLPMGALQAMTGIRRALVDLSFF